MNKVVTFGDFVFGILEVEQDHGEIDIMELLEQADATMYEQKKEHKKQSLSGLPDWSFEEGAWEQADKTGNKSRFPSHGRIEVDHGGKNANTDR